MTEGRETSPGEAVDRMMARGVRVALVAYARALQDALAQGVSSAVLVSEGIPWEDIEKVLLSPPARKSTLEDEVKDGLHDHPHP